jgi:hypothetical protein
MFCGSWINESQELVICPIRVVTVELSETMRKVMFWLFEEKAAVARGPPGRVVLSGEPYSSG